MNMEMINEVAAKYGAMLAQPSLLLTGVIIGTAILGLIYCFFGYKVIRGLAALIGFAAGASIGLVVVSVYSFEFPVSLIIPIAAGLVLALIAFFLYKLGVFAAVFAAAFSVTISLLQSYIRLDDEIAALIALAAALVCAILSVIFLRPVVIILTALIGGMMFADELFEYLIQIRWDAQMEMLIRLGAGIVLGLIGMIFQFVTTRNRK
ncbi:MAG: DUF4203 domain-containing protein [Lachnospiraceae bacterium]|nr:DUF4203 domain-containing protein [Lachnospiraceae bacterium]